MEVFQIFNSVLGCTHASDLNIQYGGNNCNFLKSAIYNLMPKFFSDTELNQFCSILLYRCRPNSLGILKKKNLFLNCTVIVIIHFSTSMTMIWIFTFLIFFDYPMCLFDGQNNIWLLVQLVLLSCVMKIAFSHSN